MGAVVNFQILRNPVNWLIVFAVVLMASWCGFTIWNAAQGNLEIGR